MKTLIVMAHPDDEIIWGWPVFQNSEIEKKVLICTSDFYNKDREFCKYRKEALFTICKKMEVECECLDYPSSFYRQLGSRSEISGKDNTAPLRKACDHIIETIEDFGSDCDRIMTHNPYGEYGHMDHRLLFDIILKNAQKDIIITDICLASNWSKEDRVSGKTKSIFYKNKQEYHEMDQELLEYCKHEYMKKNGWTWSRQIPKSCNTFLI
tara:strand:- start:21043 stop:21672 length:630 start_codon:yes stop_codon:yes gene_type:complete